MFLSDTDIYTWNQRIDMKQRRVTASYSSNRSYPDIKIVSGDSASGDFNTKFRMAFSITAKRSEEFQRILSKILSEGFVNHIFGSDSPIKADQSCIKSIEKTKHFIGEAEYERFEYLFEGKISNIIAYTHCIESTIKWFQKIWAYDEDGSEYRLLKYREGDIVSPKNDLSKDFLVVDLKYLRLGNEYTIEYTVAEMFSNGSPIIEYGRQRNIREEDLCPSRNDRINRLLN